MNFPIAPLEGRFGDKAFIVGFYLSLCFGKITTQTDLSEEQFLISAF